MRIVSQDGIYDLPYEMAIICCEELVGGTCWVNALLNDASCTVAKYSNKEKALKAMEMLRTQCKMLETSRCFLQGTGASFNANSCRETLLEIRDSHIFRFPEDKDVEV